MSAELMGGASLDDAILTSSRPLNFPTPSPKLTWTACRTATRRKARWTYLAPATSPGFRLWKSNGQLKWPAVTLEFRERTAKLRPRPRARPRPKLTYEPLVQPFARHPRF